MLNITEFDVKTGVTLQEFDPATQTLQPKQKQVEHSFLEHWLQSNGIRNAQLFLGKFYDRVSDVDRQRLEADNKILVFSNGRTGYFTDPETARLITKGDSERGIQSIYAADHNTAHNLIAYGSLIVSDGMSSTVINSATAGRKARILVIDDEARSHGSEVLHDRNNREISPEDLNQLYDKMGDGTMLLDTSVMKRLLTTTEVEQAIVKVLEKAGIEADVSELVDIYEREGTLKTAHIPSEAAEAIDKRLNYLTHTTVTQFRAATPDLPGMVKGTLATSRWCERLGVDAIISKNDIKGDDGVLSKPGIKEVEQFWINRKSDGKYGEQVVGPQVKGCIPDATLTEFNPRMLAQAEALAAVAVDPRRLGQYYLDQKNKQREVLATDDSGVDEQSDWLYEVLKVDQFGQLDQFSKINYELDRYLRGERVDLAVGGIYIPSAMAQHHAQLMPWEVCNKDLPHGAIVAYYRSPFPNVGAAAIAINNTEILDQADPEAFRKEGVAYLNPWTAKHVAITDFDKDANGYFVGYLPAVDDLPNQIRAQLASTVEQSPAEQYEAGRSLFGQLIAQMQAEPEQALIRPGDFPVAVAEIIDRNAPDRKPPEVIKQQKVKHTWNQEQESLSEATWRAWEMTANNPTGKVANVSMILQSLALETQYIAAEQKEPLLVQISTHYKKLLESDTVIPDNATLLSNGFPAYSFRDRMDAIAQATEQLSTMLDVGQRQQFVEAQLNDVYQLLTDVVDGPNAVNLQTAVDTAKNSKGIDESIQAFAKALAHKPHELRQHQKDSTIYTNGKLMPTNTQEPIGWGVEAINRLYEATQLVEYPNEAYRDLFPKNFTPEQEEKALAIVEAYNNLVKQAIETKERLRENRPEDQQPTLILTSPKTGKQLTLQRLCDVNPDDSPIWDANGEINWQTLIQANPRVSKSNPEQFLVQRVLRAEDGTETRVPLGFVAPESAIEHQFEERLRQHSRIPIANPIVQLRPPLALQSDAKEQLAKAAHYLQSAVAEIPAEERMAYASAMWRQSTGMGIVLKAFTPEICQQLQTVPEITLTGIQRETNEAGRIPDGEYTIRFSQYAYQTKDGEARTTQSVAIVEADGTEKQFGAIEPRSMRLPIGTTVTAKITTPLSDKVTAKTAIGNITIKKISEHDLRDRAWHSESAMLYVDYRDQTPIAQVEVDGTRRKLGILDSTSERKLRNSKMLQVGSFQGTQAVLDRSPGNVAQVQVIELIAQPLARSVQQALEERANKSADSVGIKITGKTVQMTYPLLMYGERNPLPVDNCLDAMRGYGRCHTTRTFEPYKAYGFKEGDIAIAYAGDRKVAFRVGEQYRITPAMVADLAYQEQWAEMEKHSAKALPQLFLNKQEVWGLKMEPLGDYKDGQIVPFPPTQVAQSSSTNSLPAVSTASEQGYAPSRQELLDWYTAVKAKGDVSRLEGIKAIGNRLRQVFNQEQGTSEANAVPPPDYRNLGITISLNEQRVMCRDITSFQNAISALHDPVGIAQFQVANRRQPSQAEV
ncbi:MULTISPECIES: hypothetical protein [Leptolyngbya]|uniref:hypothetical protein n=1 Tax=Leptolyngbya TaxID=47251 RepID=UPI0016844600|nr:hypothetical protein [Leptolyngbya sp. FACHB-1624]MBD1854795.1 hypothetical protein [Leptolyngbya sp. FACHB-1624]